MFLALEKKYIEVNGETMAYIEKGQGEETIVLVHGNFSSCYHYEPLYKRIPDNYRVIAMDLRGFGDSTYNKPIETVHDFGDDLNAFLEALNIKNAIVVGWSLGGCMSMSLAARYPDKVKKLVLLASGSAKGYPVFRKNKYGESKVGDLYTKKEELYEDVGISTMLSYEKTSNYKLMEFVWNSTIYTAGNKPTEEENKILLGETFKQRNLIDVDWALMHFNITDSVSFYAPGENIAKDIKCPILAINGRLDLTVPEIMTLENRVAMPSLKQIYYEACAHSVLVDQPDQLLNDLLEFINQ